MPNTHSTLTSLFTDIASAIREKGGTTASIVADTFPTAIRNLPSGGEDLLPGWLSSSGYKGSGVNYSSIYSDLTLLAPFALAGYGITYSGYSNSNTISMPNLVSIGFGGFFMARISSFSLPNVNYVGAYAFYSITSLLKSISLPKATFIGSNAFRDCKSLSVISFPMLQSISEYGFYGCSRISSVLYNSTVTYVGAYAFALCTSLTTVSLPNATNVNAFSGCTKLSSVSMPFLGQLGAACFINCTSLTSIVLPVVSLMHKGAFSGCTKLESVYILSNSVPGTAMEYANTIFTNTPILNSSYLGRFGSIYVRESVYSNFINDTNWKGMSSRFVSLTDAQVQAILNS